MNSMSIENGEPFADGLTLYRGIETVPFSQLIEKSTQSHVLENEPDDCDYRFTDEAAYLRWSHDMQPMVLWLGSAVSELAGIAWIENAYTKGPKRNFGVRVYEGFENQGLGTYLSEELHAQFDSLKPTAKTQFEMKATNNSGFSIGAHLGYKLDADRSRSTMRMQLFVRNDRNLR